MWRFLVARHVLRPVHLPRLALHTVLQEAKNAVNVLAPICSSWGMPARSTSGRTYFNWQGYERYDFCTLRKCHGITAACQKITFTQPIKAGPTVFDHILANRSIFVIENPSSSLIYRHYRFEWLCNKVAFVWPTCMPSGLFHQGLASTVLDGPPGLTDAKADAGLEQ